MKRKPQDGFFVTDGVGASDPYPRGSICMRCKRPHEPRPDDSGVFFCLDVDAIAERLKQPETARAFVRLLLASAARKRETEQDP